MSTLKPIQVRERLWWVGAGSSASKLYCNPFLYVCGERGVLFDPGSVLDAQAVIAQVEGNADHVLSGTTQVLIAPGYTFRFADALITNFHQPQSTLLLLVAAFVGPDWRMVYDHALAHGYRFLSYGDGSLLHRPGKVMIPR